MGNFKKNTKNPYGDAGVNVETGDEMVEWLGETTKDIKTRPFGEIVAGIGDFSALFRPNFGKMKDPLLVSSTDGVGTKLLLGIEQDRLEGIGCDLVGMCVNDLYCCGARPLFFLDYFATGRLDTKQFKIVLGGIKSALNKCETFLIGGETAEMPGLYQDKHFDLAGFVVGVVDASKRLSRDRVQSGDRLFAIESSGFHSNGFSLIRKWLTKKPGTAELLQKILEPTRVYSFFPQIFDQMPNEGISALANITGGGLSGNISRIIPDDCTAIIDKSKLRIPVWMRHFFRENDFDDPIDLEGVFNLGVGMVAAVKSDKAASFEKMVNGFCLCYEVGKVEDRKDSSVLFR